MKRIFVLCTLLCIGVLCCNTFAFSAQNILQVVAFDDVYNELNSNKERKFIVFFTSWCGHCKDKLPAVISAIGKIDEKFYFISLDENIEYAENFLKSLEIKKGKNMKFFIFDNEDSIAKFVYQFTPTYSGSVPYLIVLNSANSPTYEGGLSIEHVIDVLKRKR
ncbi:thioredoxin family protein [Candidatus Fokinia crypta]|uniref:Thioredoxin-like protein n=1 Tax=Candidatus Fokinia crypta TaxID=1920990 RepID=A0ABZ0URZ8_9RICK|nr:thioredoxin family protein [Candidatus Fokinia cryptica]WPX97923.1 Thioredoxin-like protein [Candidatus Fokinia cryptica]